MRKRKPGRSSSFRESTESKEFRRAMQVGEGPEGMHEAVKLLMRKWVESGIIAGPCKPGTLGRICVFDGSVHFNGEQLPIFRPLGEVSDVFGFEMAVCSAGLKRFVRHSHESENGSGLVYVQEIMPGIIFRTGLRKE